MQASLKREFELFHMLHHRKMDNDTETFNETDCYVPIPNISDYFDALPNHQLYITIAICILAVISVIIYLNTISWITYNSPKHHITSNILLCSVYPIACLMSAASIIIPRSYFFCETISHIAFLVCAFVLFSLFMKYVEGDSNLIKNKYTGKSAEFTVATPPCCCCCALCLHPGPISKSKISLVRWLILQLCIIHAGLFTALNIIQINDSRTFDVILPYFIPVLVPSIILGIWGLNIMVRMFLTAVPSTYKIKQKYFSVQLVLLICKAQPGLVKIICGFFLTDDCSSNESVIPLASYLNVYIQLAVCIELVLVGSWASRLYRFPSRL